MSEPGPPPEPHVPASGEVGSDRRQRTAHRPRPTPRRRWPPWLARAGLLAIVLVVGLVIGMAIADGGAPSGEQTVVNTLKVSTLAPSETVTVTVSSP